MTDLDATATARAEEPPVVPDAWHIKRELVAVVVGAGDKGITLRALMEQVRDRLDAPVVDLDPYVDSLCRIGVLEFGESPDTRRLHATDRAEFFIEGARTFG